MGNLAPVISRLFTYSSVPLDNQPPILAVPHSVVGTLLPLYSLWHSTVTLRDLWPSSHLHVDPECGTFLTWPGPPSPTPHVRMPLPARQGAPHTRPAPAHVYSLASLPTLGTNTLFLITFGTLDLLCCYCWQKICPTEIIDNHPW